jgi:hypothetical protein
VPTPHLQKIEFIIFKKNVRSLMPRDEKERRKDLGTSVAMATLYSRRRSSVSFLPHYMYIPRWPLVLLKHLQKGSPIQRIDIQVRVMMMCHGEK